MRQKRKKGSFKLGHWVMGIAFIGMFMVIWGNVIAEFNTNYAVTVDESFTGTFNQLETMGNLTKDMQDKVVGAEIDDADPAVSLSTAMLNAVRLILQTPVIIIQFVYEVVNEGIIPIYPELQVAILIMTVLSVIFGIIGMVYGDKLK